MRVLDPTRSIGAANDRSHEEPTLSENHVAADPWGLPTEPQATSVDSDVADPDGGDETSSAAGTPETAGAEDHSDAEATDIEAIANQVAAATLRPVNETVPPRAPEPAAAGFPGLEPHADTRPVAEAQTDNEYAIALPTTPEPLVQVSSAASTSPGEGVPVDPSNGSGEEATPGNEDSPAPAAAMAQPGAPDDGADIAEALDSLADTLSAGTEDVAIEPIVEPASGVEAPIADDLDDDSPESVLAAIHELGAADEPVEVVPTTEDTPAASVDPHPTPMDFELSFDTPPADEFAAPENSVSADAESAPAAPSDPGVSELTSSISLSPEIAAARSLFGDTTGTGDADAPSDADDSPAAVGTADNLAGMLAGASEVASNAPESDAGDSGDPGLTATPPADEIPDELPTWAVDHGDPAVADMTPASAEPAAAPAAPALMSSDTGDSPGTPDDAVQASSALWAASDEPTGLDAPLASQPTPSVYKELEDLPPPPVGQPTVGAQTDADDQPVVAAAAGSETEPIPILGEADVDVDALAAEFGTGPMGEISADVKPMPHVTADATDPELSVPRSFEIVSPAGTAADAATETPFHVSETAVPSDDSAEAAPLLASETPGDLEPQHRTESPIDTEPPLETEPQPDIAAPLATGPLETGPLETGPLATGPLETGPLETGTPETGHGADVHDATTMEAEGLFTDPDEPDPALQAIAPLAFEIPEQQQQEPAAAQAPAADEPAVTTGPDETPATTLNGSGAPDETESPIVVPSDDAPEATPPLESDAPVFGDDLFEISAPVGSVSDVGTPATTQPDAGSEPLPSGVAPVAPGLTGWATLWAESAQGWVDTDGDTIWRPIVATTASIDGWTAETYLGLVTADATMAGIDDLGVSQSAALDSLVAEALARGAHAVVGTSLSVHSMGENMFVHATGTAVTLAPAGD